MNVNSRGFSFVGILVAIALTGVVSIAFASMASMQAKSYANQKEGSEILDLHTNIRNALAMPGQCGCNFAGRQLASNGAGLNDFSLYNVDPATGACSAQTPIAILGEQTPGGLNVSSIAIENPQQIAPNLVSAELVVRVRGQYIPRNPVRSPRLYLQTQASAAGTTIQGCKAAGTTRVTKAVRDTDYPIPWAAHDRQPFTGWQRAAVDEIGAWNPANPGVLTVPQGVSKVRVHISLCFAQRPGSYQIDAAIHHNTVAVVKSVVAHGQVISLMDQPHALALQAHSDVIDVQPGDTFTATITPHETGDTIAGSATCFTPTQLSMETVD